MCARQKREQGAAPTFNLMRSTAIANTLGYTIVWWLAARSALHDNQTIKLN